MAKHRIDIRGNLIPNSYKWFYDWLEMDATCPADVQKVLSAAGDGDDIDVYINSPGGLIDVGSEIYTLLREASARCNVEIYITGEACSAASVVACAAHSTMSPTALMMVHCVSTSTSGNHADMEHTAEVLRTADQAMCSAYTAKTGMTQQEALDLMERETFLTAQQAKDIGLVDEIMFEEQEDAPMAAASGLFKLPTQEQMNRVRQMMRTEIEPEEGTKTGPGYHDALRRNREIAALQLSCGRDINCYR